MEAQEAVAVGAAGGAAAVAVPDSGAPDTVSKMFWHGVRTRDGKTFCRQKEFGIWRAVTWAELGEIAREIGMGLAALGFAIEDFGSGSLIARAAPAELSGLGADALLDLLRAALADAAGWRERLLATAACRAAVKKGDPLDPDGARELLGRLAATHAPAVCPHGSPVVVRLAGGLLARLFRW